LYWKVGDSREENVCFMMALTKAKQQLVLQKNDSSLEYTISREDILARHFLNEEVRRDATVVAPLIV
jgi:hypothetical protein